MEMKRKFVDIQGQDGVVIGNQNPYEVAIIDDEIREAIDKLKKDHSKKPMEAA